MYSIFERLMNEAGETHYQVAKATGVSQSTLSDWKLGKTTPRNPTLKKLADHYGVSVPYLKGETAERTVKEKPAGQVADGLTEEEIEYIKWFRTQATEKEKTLVRIIVKGEAK